MSTVNVRQAKTHFSQLLRRVAAGEEVIISDAGKPVARLMPIGGKTRKLGTDVGAFKVPEDFINPLPARFLDDFEV